MPERNTRNERAGLSSGPRKRVPEGYPLPRWTLHKVRSTWFQSRTAWPVREPAASAMVRERRRVRRALESPVAPVQWENAGPTNIGGRMTSVVCHPTDPDHIWAGSAGGGVWESSDAGQSWRTFWNSQDILNIGSVAIDLQNPAVLYCGTGEANLSADSYPGVGLYQSTNAGRSWRLIAASGKANIPKRIGAIAIDPFDSQHILLGGVGFGEVDREGGFGGLYASLDGGLTWRRETFVSPNNYWCHSIAFHPTQRGTIFATVTERGVRNGIWRTTDGGATWSQLTAGLPDPTMIERTSLRIAPSNPSVLYALASDASDQVLGVFRSADGGNSWTDIQGNGFGSEGQMQYGNSIAIHPQNPDHVICGGVDLHLTTNGGQRWRRVTRWDANRGDTNYAHADHHALVMPTAAPGRIYDMNDGGMDVSEDGGRTWTNRSNGLAVTMFYDMDVAQSDGRVYAGGAQDNGTVATTTGAAAAFFEMTGGDGGWVIFDPRNANHVYSSSQFMSIYRFTQAGGWQEVTPPTSQLPNSERGRIWMAFMAMDPNDSRTVFMGSVRVWRTKDDGNSWTAVSGPLDNSPITAVEVAVSDSRRIYVGTDNGGIFRSLDGGNTWSADISGSTLPGFTITRLATRSDNADVVYASVANSGHSHVFRSLDGGLHWEDVDTGQLPDVPHHAVVCWPGDPNNVYVSNDVGVYFSADRGATWMNLTGNLPNVMVIDLVCHTADGTLSVATYGRGIWRLRVR
jgi:photosystem II stability/assembly factor-like uncharacterized protein